MLARVVLLALMAISGTPSSLATDDVGLLLACDHTFSDGGDCEALAHRLRDLGYRVRTAAAHDKRQPQAGELVVHLDREPDRIAITFEDGAGSSGTTSTVAVEGAGEELRRVALVIDALVKSDLDALLARIARRASSAPSADASSAPASAPAALHHGSASIAALVSFDGLQPRFGARLEIGMIAPRILYAVAAAELDFGIEHGGAASFAIGYPLTFARHWTWMLGAFAAVQFAFERSASALIVGGETRLTVDLTPHVGIRATVNAGYAARMSARQGVWPVSLSLAIGPIFHF